MTSSQPQAVDQSSLTPFTVIITGLSPIFPLSANIVSALIKSLHSVNPQQPISIALLGSDLTYLQTIITEISSSLPSTTLNDHHSSNTDTNTTNNNLTLLPVQCTLSSAESLGLASHHIRATLGAWDLFIHNPSAHVSSDTEVHHPATIRGSDADTWWSVFEVNVHALHPIARHFFPKMKRGAMFFDILPAPVPMSDEGSPPSSSSAVLLLLSGEVSGPPVLLSASRTGSLQDRKSAERAAALAAAAIVDYLAAEHAESGLKCLKVAFERYETVLMRAEREAAAYAEEIVKLVSLRART